METAGLRLGDALTALAQELMARTHADACVLSRVVGDALIVTRTLPDEAILTLGLGSLVSDSPATAHVLRSGEAASLTVDDDGVDEQEAALLRELGYATLLMLPFDLAGERWGLVELYRREVRPFSAAEIAAARAAAHLG